MKKHFKKLLITLLAAVGAICLAVGIAACNNEGEQNPTPKPNLVPLIAPTVTLTDNVLSWKAVSHATGYVVYEDDEIVSEQTETTYTITQDYPGTYGYMVKAITTEQGYKESPLSAAKTFKVNPWPLEAPVISIDQATGIITWTAVNHADGYDIYQEGTRVASVGGCSYTIEETTPKVFSYTVKATSTDKAYSTSEHSEPATYKVPLHLSIGVEFPDNYTGSATLSLYDEATGNFVAETTVERDQNMYDPEAGESGGYSAYGSAKLVVEWGNYVAKLSDLQNGFVATWAHVSTQRRSGSITIIEKTENNVLSLNKNSVTLTLPAGENSVTANYVFIAGSSEDGAHSILVDSGVTGLQITVAGRTVISSAQSTYNGSFLTEEGEVSVISVTYTKPNSNSGEEEVETLDGEAPADEQIAFEFEIVNYEIRQYLKLLPEPFNIERYEEAHYENYVNIVYDSCGRYIQVQEEGTYEFMFLSSTTGDRTITLTINGEEYAPGFGGGTTSVRLQAGTEVRIQIDIEGTGYGGAEFVSFWVYKI